MWKIILVTLSLVLPLSASAKPATRVFLNGRPTPVYFNDGDSFRVLAGPLKDTKARLAGFNTLESYGPVHRWSTWTAKELYWNAKLATLNARKGVWHCTSKDLKTDTYGRILWFCKDLAVDQLRRGLAHVFSVDHHPGDPALLEAQAEAQRRHRGMWAKGVPDYILTSLHSAAEGGRHTYNRIISSADGHSASQRHDQDYAECQWVCVEARPVEAAAIQAAYTQLRATQDPALKAILAALGEARLRQIIGDYARLGWVTNLREPAQEAALDKALASIFPAGTREKGACALYVDYRRRFGRQRASCLK